MRQLGGTVLPLEISTPPIPANRLDELNKLEQELQTGTPKEHAPVTFNAFALHFNPEPGRSSRSVLRGPYAPRFPSCCITGCSALKTSTGCGS